MTKFVGCLCIFLLGAGIAFVVISIASVSVAVWG